MSCSRLKGHMDQALVEVKISRLKRSAGMRDRADVEYSSEYVRILRAWMVESKENEAFEDDLVKTGKILIEFNYTQLGLDFILESTAPREDMEFESGSIRYVELNPEDQIPKRVRNEAVREEKRSGYVRAMDLWKADFDSAAGLGPKVDTGFLFLHGELGIFAIPEPPYADFCRNSPPDLKISHLRRLREDGYFHGKPKDTQIAAYLLAKLYWRREQIEPGFANLISWTRFQSAAASVHRAIRKTLPERFKRIEKVKAFFSEKQLEAFDARYDIDLFPTLDEAAANLNIDRSSLNERMHSVRKKARVEFSEFKGIKRRPKSWSRECDLKLSGLYRASLDYFRAASWRNKKSNESQVVTESVHVKTIVRTSDEVKDIKRKLRDRIYPPELKTVTASSNRGAFEVKRGGFFHHEHERTLTKIWETLYFSTWYTSREVTILATFIRDHRMYGANLFAVRRKLRAAQRRMQAKGAAFGPPSGGKHLTLCPVIAIRCVLGPRFGELAASALISSRS
jgi:hypothetical protein